MRAAGQKPPTGPPVMALAKANVADESVVVFIGCPRQDSLRTVETNLFPESSLPSHPAVVSPPAPVTGQLSFSEQTHIAPLRRLLPGIPRRGTFLRGTAA